MWERKRHHHFAFGDGARLLLRLADVEAIERFTDTFFDFPLNQLGRRGRWLRRRSRVGRSDELSYADCSATGDGATGMLYDELCDANAINDILGPYRDEYGPVESFAMLVTTRYRLGLERGSPSMTVHIDVSKLDEDGPHLVVGTLSLAGGSLKFYGERLHRELGNRLDAERARELVRCLSQPAAGKIVHCLERTRPELVEMLFPGTRVCGGVLCEGDPLEHHILRADDDVKRAVEWLKRVRRGKFSQHADDLIGLTGYELSCLSEEALLEKCPGLGAGGATILRNSIAVCSAPGEAP